MHITFDGGTLMVAAGVIALLALAATVASLISLPLSGVLPAVRARFGAFERGFYLSAIA